VINDFETTEAARRACLLQVARGLLDRGVPLHAVGHQMHVGLERPTRRALVETLDAVAALGLENQVTELDMTLGTARTPGDEPALLQRQGERYAELFRVLARRPDVTSVTFWGVTDANTWLNRMRPGASIDRPLPFDAARRPKPAYHAIAQAADE
jgi:endo-1,4-beta-xylanase